MMFILSSMLVSCMLGLILVMLNLVRNLILQLSIFPTIQKPDDRQSVDLTMAGFAESLRPEKFTGVNFKIWKSNICLWFTTMHIWDMRLGKHVDVLTAEDRRSTAMPIISLWDVSSATCQTAWSVCTLKR